jgi:NAD(P)-dependent dehydrogenase (short-subunit alcohol dehydrogenase family)
MVMARIAEPSLGGLLMGELDGKVAVITGAGSGMAKASVKVFTREGAKVVAADVSGAEKDTAAEVGSGVVPFHCDVTKEDDVEALMRAAVDEFGRLDAVLNVAGIAEGVMLTDVTMEQYDRTMDVDLRGVFLGMKHGIRTMLAAGNGGAVVNWSSIGGLNSSIATSVYGAAKAGVVSLTKTGALEYASKGIRVNCVCPGYIKTEIMGATLDDFPGAAKGTPLKRLGQPHEIAEVAAFLCSERASFVTGAVIPVDGGRAAMIA